MRQRLRWLSALAFLLCWGLRSPLADQQEQAQATAARNVPRVSAPARKQKGRRSTSALWYLVETRRIELPTSALRTRRSPS